LTHAVALDALGVPQTGQIFLLAMIASGDGVVWGVGTPSTGAVGWVMWKGSSCAAFAWVVGCVVLLLAIEHSVHGSCPALADDELEHPAFIPPSSNAALTPNNATDL
jgi:hypothetical protein